MHIAQVFKVNLHHLFCSDISNASQFNRSNELYKYGLRPLLHDVLNQTVQHFNVDMDEVGPFLSPYRVDPYVLYGGHGNPPWRYQSATQLKMYANPGDP